MRSSQFSLAIWIMFFTLPVFADGLESWTVGGQPYSTYYDSQLGASVSVSCKDAPCGVKEILDKAGDVPIDPALASGFPDGGWRIGNFICRQLNGTVAMGVDARGNQNYFCVAPDHTIIDLRLLAHRKPRQ